MIGTEDMDKRKHTLFKGSTDLIGFQAQVEGTAHSPRNRCTALTASASSTTSEKILNSFVHSRARAATVLAPGSWLDCRSRPLGQGRQGCGEELGNQVSSLNSPSRPQPQAPLPSCCGPRTQHFKSLEQCLSQGKHSKIMCPMNG